MSNGKEPTAEGDIEGGTMSWVHVSIGSETISSTPEHPYFILNASSNTPIVRFEGRETSSTGNWVAAKDLVAGMKVLLSNGKYGTISMVEVEHLEQPETTYNFEVEDYHTYYVSKNSVCVHNIGGLDCNGLTRTQRRNIKNIRNNIDDHLTVRDIQAALGDVQGNPIPNLQRGDMWQHFTEVQNAYRGISKSSAALQASLANPNLSAGARAIITTTVNEANMYISMLDNLFLPFGGL